MRSSALCVILCISVSQVLLFGQSTEQQLQRPRSDSQTSTDADQHAHTNYVFFPLDQPLQNPQLALSLKEIALPAEGASPLQIVRPRSDLSFRSTAEDIARFAYMAGEPPPPGADLRAHTNYQFLAKANRAPGLPLSAIANNTPSEIRERYGLPSNGVGGVIIVVDAYDYPTAEADLARFSIQFGLPLCSVANHCLQIVKMAPNIQKDTDPGVFDCGWSGEAAIDLQWAHAIAPQAKLVLVEATSSRVKDLFTAVARASEIAELSGGGVVSLSWSYDEPEGDGSAGNLLELANDKYFQHDTVLYFASSGDRGGRVTYPSASPLVISVGGTDVVRDANNKILVEKGWSESGGGNSNIEPRPTFQIGVENITEAGRVTPDIAGPAGLDTTGANGSPVYAGTTCRPYGVGWYSVGGTSLATPILAAATTFMYPKGGKTGTILENIYNQRRDRRAIRDITVGQAGANLARIGYDKVTGVGVPASTQFGAAPGIP